MSYYIHNVPGRLRVKSPVVKRNDDAADEIRKTLSTMIGIATVDINLTTGSILINYNPKTIHHNDIINTLQRTGFFDTSRALNTDQYIHRAASQAGTIVGKVIFGTFVEKALEGSALSLITLLI
ncbi:MAG: HMA2 domain-containing protein [Thermodesulfovibrionales bacterium]|jgi:copper chaperone CopZ